MVITDACMGLMVKAEQQCQALVYMMQDPLNLSFMLQIHLKVGCSWAHSWHLILEEPLSRWIRLQQASIEIHLTCTRKLYSSLLAAVPCNLRTRPNVQVLKSLEGFNHTADPCNCEPNTAADLQNFQLKPISFPILKCNVGYLVTASNINCHKKFTVRQQTSQWRVCYFQALVHSQAP